MIGWMLSAVNRRKKLKAYVIGYFQVCLFLAMMNKLFVFPAAKLTLWYTASSANMFLSWVLFWSVGLDIPVSKDSEFVATWSYI